VTIKELKIKLIEKDKTAIWLSTQLGYSPAYMYRVIEEKKEKEIERIKTILSNV